MSSCDHLEECFGCRRACCIVCLSNECAECGVNLCDECIDEHDCSVEEEP